MSQAVISELNIFPVKSLQGVALQQAELTEQGIRWDRFWMIVNDDGQFATQRHFTKMAQIKTELTAEALILSHPEASPLIISLQYQGDGNVRLGKVWGSECQVLDEGETARQWLTQLLGTWRDQSLSLVRMAPEYSREVSENHTVDGASNTTYFADGYPYLVCNTASLAELNKALEQQQEAPVPMSRFRANIVVDSDIAFIEHQSPELKFEQNEDASLHLCKPCQRCKITAIDQSSGEVEAPKQPLTTLMAMTHVDKKGAFFGQNAVVKETAKSRFPVHIKLGQTVIFN